jgi:hypothetical protein
MQHPPAGFHLVGTPSNFCHWVKRRAFQTHTHTRTHTHAHTQARTQYIWSWCECITCKEKSADTNLQSPLSGHLKSKNGRRQPAKCLVRSALCEEPVRTAAQGSEVLLHMCDASGHNDSARRVNSPHHDRMQATERGELHGAWSCTAASTLWSCSGAVW